MGGVWLLQWLLSVVAVYMQMNGWCLVVAVVVVSCCSLYADECVVAGCCSGCCQLLQSICR